jgi:hypothetical protein
MPRRITLAALAAAAVLVARPAAGQGVIPGMPAESFSAQLAMYRAELRLQVDSLLRQWETALSDDDLGALGHVYAPGAGLGGTDTAVYGGPEPVLHALRPLLACMGRVRLALRSLDSDGDRLYGVGDGEYDVVTLAGERLRLTTPFAFILRRGFPETWQVAWHRLGLPIATGTCEGRGNAGR